ncbi:PLDc N-terminal domain-containing protein [Maribellus sediminis]|uniref:PLDc N-terminal domain-containing protein n=1 Tax=Maribellus sediminis TaxID=2696285 RepID=UPI00142FECB2|nr:PLD nuclease N-terminal domain-containing protein [Maribellus sediminis]
MILLGFIGPQELIMILIISLFLFILPIIALVDIIRSEFTGNNKIVWVLIVIFFNIIGSILYFLMGRNQKVKN